MWKFPAKRQNSFLVGIAPQLGTTALNSFDFSFISAAYFKKLRKVMEGIPLFSCLNWYKICLNSQNNTFR